MLKRIRFVIIIVVLVLVFLPGFSKLQEMRLKLADLEKDVLKVKKDNALLEQRIAQLQNNPEYLEMVARNRMGIVRKGETPVRIIREGEEVNTPVANVTGNQTNAIIKD